MSEGRMKSFKNKGKDAAVSKKSGIICPLSLSGTIVTDDGTGNHETFAMLILSHISYSQR